ncbi:MAG: glycosyltransferase [Bacteroidales bacterium]|nr:glycosyltransferase [Bacteroidales bacterium]
MRLIFVTCTLNSGGAERVISILANYFSSKYNTEIICWRKDEIFYQIDPAVKIIELEDYGKNLITKLLSLRKHFKKDDIIIPFMEEIYGRVLISVIGQKRTVIPSERNDPSKTKIHWRIARRLLQFKITAFVVQTETIKEYYTKAFQKKICIIPNPVDTKQYTTDQWNKESKMVLAVARTDPQKNYPMMINAFAQLHKSHPEYVLEIYGSKDKGESYCQQLFRLIASNNAGQYIHIHGRHQNVAQLYSQAYMFVMSSDYEGMSNSLIEAMCSGRPVISTKVSGARDLIQDKENGMLVDVGDQNAFTNALKQLIEDPNLAQSLANNATKLREVLSKETICSMWDELLIKKISSCPQSQS